MDKLKQWVALTVVGCLAIMAAGWFLLVAPKRTEAAELRTQASDQQATNAKLQNELQVLKAQAKELPKEQAKLAAVAAKIPDNPALPSLVRSLLEAAEATGVELVSITPSDPVVLEPAAPSKPVAEGAAAQQAPGSTPGTPAKPKQAAPPPPAAGQLAQIPVTVNVVGDYFQVQMFLGAVEELARALRVTSLDVAPGASPTDDKDSSSKAVEEGKSLSATVTGFVYMAAHRPAPLTATVPGDSSAPADAVAADAAAAETAVAGE